MSLIPFILDLAEELHDFNRSLAMDIDDLGFGMYPLEHQVQAQTQTHSHPYAPQLSRPALRLGLGSSPTTSSSVLWVPIKGQHAASPATQHRHHPYNRVAGAKTVCCNKSLLELEKELGEKGSGSGAATGAGGTTATSPATSSKSAYSVVNRNGFQVSMNVKQFSARELTVRTIDNCIVVEGQHDEKEDGHGVISRHFIRKYMLPKGFDPAEVHSTLSSDGILTVKAPPPPPPANKAGVERLERIVDIQQLLQSQLQPKDAQTPKPVPTEAHAQTEAEPRSVAAPTPTAGAAATPESNGNGQAEAVAAAVVAAAVDVDADIAVPAEAAAKAVETTSTTCTSTTTSNSSANNGVKLESEPMEVATNAEASTPKEDSTPNPTAAVVSSSEEESKTEPNANDVAVSSNNGSSGNGNTDTDVAPVVGEDEDIPMATAKSVGEEKQHEKEPEKAAKSSKGAEELAAVDAAILLAKNQPAAEVGENGAAAVGGENGASAGGENGAAAAKAEEVAAK
ncbi:heat shock protein 67B1 [Drosophila guanche]|uniref:Blast:Heat shock protein 67B1 n=1 Tax=Drosophila guanche TaxID=7266 RepID=A0A3B0J6A6_DROGU|nr:heat shock protein 67B1 [Drosophila guanche]SPP77487.1 blast:Heat shock protein 67B1 [Drosophila guanche]